MSENADMENNIPILFEDENILVINKPSGISVHADGVNNRYCLSDWIIEKYPELRNVGEAMFTENGTKVVRPGIVHRLDRQTSGVLLIAKNQKTFQFLKKQFQNRTIEKVYKALVYGNPKNKEGEISISIGRSTQDPRKRAAKKGGKVKNALTKYKIIKNYKNFSYLEVYPKTGRTHQIRVHLTSIGHPVLCDALYSKFPCPSGLSRLALHAEKITFLSVQGEKKAIVAPLPKEFSDFLEKQESL